jgi:hypothetical protein
MVGAQFKQQLLRYWLAMNASALQAGTHSVRAFLGVAGVHAVSATVAALTLEQTAAVFLLAFGSGLLNYLDTHPLPQPTNQLK